MKALVTKEQLPMLGDLMLEWFQQNPEQVWLKSFCIAHKFSAGNLWNWAKENEHFAECLEMCKDIQEYRLCQMGLNQNAKNSIFVIFALKNVAGWRDNKDRELGDEDFDKSVCFATK